MVVGFTVTVKLSAAPGSTWKGLLTPLAVL
jgi:hypothetical protein